MNIKDGTSTFEVVYHKATFKGMIMPFSGSFDSDGYPIDSATNITRKDWHICDGTNGTPDLRGRFILGANSGHAVGSTGGEETHTLQNSELPERTVVSLNVEGILSVPWNTVTASGWGATSMYDYHMNNHSLSGGGRHTTICLHTIPSAISCEFKGPYKESSFVISSICKEVA